MLGKQNVLRIIERRLEGRAVNVCKRKSRPVDTSFRCNFFPLANGHIDLQQPTSTYSCCASLDVIDGSRLFTHISAQWLLTVQE